MNLHTFTCARCKLDFPSETSEEEREAERQQYFPDTPTSECLSVCDSCWEEIKPNEPINESEAFNRLLRDEVPCKKCGELFTPRDALTVFICDECVRKANDSLAKRMNK